MFSVVMCVDIVDVPMKQFLVGVCSRRHRTMRVFSIAKDNTLAAFMQSILYFRFIVKSDCKCGHK